MTRAVIRMTIEDAEHYTPAQRASIIAGYPEHEREARAKGVPILGSGRIFPLADSVVSTRAIPIPDHWAQIAALDFGWTHPTAAVRLAWDRDSDVVYVTHCHKLREATPLIHAGTLKTWGDWLPWAWPHDGNNDTAAGENLSAQYRAQGMKMLHGHATFPDGSHSVEAGLMEMLTRMQTQKLRVFDTLLEWFEEFRLYHRKDGKVVKEFDDLMSATRYGLMMLRSAVPFAATAAQVQNFGEGGWMG